MDSFPPLWLLHGNGGGWAPIVARLPGFVDVVAVELPSHRHMPGSRYDAEVVTRAAQIVAERARDLKVPAPHIVGHSIGGAVALELANRMPVSGITAFCPIGFWSRPRSWYATRVFGAVARLPRVLDPDARSRLPGRRAMSRLLTGAFSTRPTDPVLASVLAGSHFPTMTMHAHRYAFVPPDDLTAPVLLAWSKRDRLVPLADAERARRLLPQATHTQIANSGHMVMHDDPDTTAAVMFAWHQHLAGLPAPTATR